MTKRGSLKRRSAAPTLVVIFLVTMLVVIGVGAGYFMLTWVRGTLANPGILPGMPNSNKPSDNVKYEFGAILPTWAGKQRITVLLLGIDERAQESGPFRTDTMMVLTLDPVAKQGGVLSLPRDLWVPIPGYNDGRINTAHFLGDLYGHPGGGTALARETVEYNLGVPIDYYVRVNFEGFVTLVNLIGGVDIYVEKTIHDPTYPDYHYGYDPLHIEPGWHHFDGEMALKYARTRHGSSDFDRARRQQQVMLAVLERVTSLNLLPDLARNAPKLYATIQTAIQTDLALDQILALANVALQVDRAQIRFGVIDHTCTQAWITPDGAQVLVPLREQMRKVRDYVFFADQPTPVPQQDTAQPADVAPTVAAVTATPEIASVAVLNGTIRGGLAGNTADYLRANGLNVVTVANADRQDYATSLIILNRDKASIATQIATLLQLPTSAIMHGTDPNAAQDIVVILGTDYTLPQN